MTYFVQSTVHKSNTFSFLTYMTKKISKSLHLRSWSQSFYDHLCLKNNNYSNIKTETAAEEFSVDQIIVLLSQLIVAVLKYFEIIEWLMRCRRTCSSCAVVLIKNSFNSDLNYKSMSSIFHKQNLKCTSATTMEELLKFVKYNFWTNIL